MSTNTATGIKSVKENLEEVKEKSESKINEYLETSNEKLGNIKEKVSENLTGAASKIHEKSDTAQDYLKEKSDQLNVFAQEKIEKANQLGHRTADALENSSDYLKNFDFAETGKQIKNTIKEKPQIGLALVGIFGLLIGLLVGRKTR